MLFPDYEADTSRRRPATRARMHRMQREAVRRLREHRADIAFCFEASCVDAQLRCRRKYRSYPIDSVRVDVERAVERVRRCIVSPHVSADAWGESDDEQVFISAAQLFTDSELLGTMLHEALHYCGTWKGHDIATHIEHMAMRALGDH